MQGFLRRLNNAHPEVLRAFNKTLEDVQYDSVLKDSFVMYEGYRVDIHYYEMDVTMLRLQFNCDTRISMAKGWVVLPLGELSFRVSYPDYAENSVMRYLYCLGYDVDSIENFEGIAMTAHEKLELKRQMKR